MSICCVRFAMNLMPGILVCISFLISVCMFIVSKVLLISNATGIARAGGAIWLKPFATVLFTVCSAVTVVVFYPCSLGVFGMFAVMQGKRLISSIFAITERRDMGMYEVPLSMSLLGFGLGTMLAKFHICGIMLMLRAVFNMLVRNACFRCLIFICQDRVSCYFYCL